MKKVLMHYFSGTGNSLLAAKQLGGELSGNGYDLTYHAVEDGPPNSDDTYTLHIFFFPVYATAVPHIMLRYLRNLPDGNHVRAAVISTNGRISTRFRDGYQGWTLHEARLFLRWKNYDVFFSDTLDFPHNVTICISPGKEDRNKKIISAAKQRFPQLAEKIAAGQEYHRKFFWPNIIWSLPFGLVYSLLGRRLLGKLFAADSACNLCGLCAAKCPAKAIQREAKVISWKWNCEGCLRCFNSCPRQAVQVSAARILAMFAAALIDPHFFIRSTGIFSTGIFGTGIFHVLLDFLTFIVSFAILDQIIYRLSRVPAVKSIVGWGYTRYFGRYSAQRFMND